MLEKEVKTVKEDGGVKFKLMLREFEAIIDKWPPVEKVKQQLLDLAESTTLTNVLTARQSDAIHGRCTNYINGTYGSNKIKEGYIKTNP